VQQQPPASQPTTDPPARRNIASWILSPQGVMRGAIVAALFPVAGWFGELHWFLDLFNHFQAQYFCFLLLATITLVLLRNFRLAAIAFGLLLIPGIRLAPLYLPTRIDPNGPVLRVACFNVLTHNRRYEDAVSWIRETSPDFIYLPEANEDWERGIAPLADAYPHKVDVFIPGNFGFSFRSKHHLVRHEIHLLGTMEIPLLEAVVATPHGEVTVFGAHPVPPVTRFWANERDTYLARLSAIAAKTHGRLVILGDLNATRWSHSLAPFFAQGIRDTAVGHGFSATWMRENPLMAVPIDHIFERGFAGTIRRWTGPALGSDHRPVVADLAW
jgi:endonuclease/exonuclease/phosphatase (EEP) superfamily protein YafD